MNGSTLLCPRRVLPLCEGALFFELFADDARASAAGELGEAVRGEREVAVGEGLARDGGGWTVDYGLEEGQWRRECITGRIITRLWSMISAMTAILPVDGPELRRTTRTGEQRRVIVNTDVPRPTSTKR